MDKKLLTLLSENAKYTADDLALMLGMTKEEVAAAIERLEDENVIRGYKTLVDWDKVDEDQVTAMIQLKVVPQASSGFEEIAQKISSFEYVESVYLMSGNYDLCVTVTGQTLRKVADFVSTHLAPMEGVESTGTCFVLRRYKDMGVEMKVNVDDREKLSF